MHGLIFMELQRFVTTNYGISKWLDLLKTAGLSGHFFSPAQVYPDENAFKLVKAASQITSLTKDEVLEKFGEFIIPDLFKMFNSFIKPEWKTMDFLENTETSIHKAVRSSNPGAEPPELKIKRTSKTEVEILYYSKRQMVALAKGMIKAVAKHYNEKISIHAVKTDEKTHKITVRLCGM